MSSSEDDSNVPDAATAQRLVKEFEGITNTDEIFAQFSLQTNEWDLSKALNQFFNEKVEKQKRAAEEQRSEPKSEPDMSMGEALNAGLLTTEAPAALTFVTWNIDGLDHNNLQKRTKAVCNILEMERADIVFLQEVVPETFSYIESKLTGYECISGSAGDYFVATLLRRGRVYRDKMNTLDFPGSVMGRHLLSVTAHCGKVKFELLNTHLESTRDHAEERKVQLKTCLATVKRIGLDRNVIFGGDLNLRDKELVEVGGLPASTRDAWETCGRRKEAEFTWDLNRNTNLEWPGKWKPRCRFDRVYHRPAASYSTQLAHFGLIGLQKITGTQSFPSDHWGLCIKLKLDQQQAASNNKRIKLQSGGD